MKRQPTEPTKQPMAELVNQCATVERLLDALAWAGNRLGPTAEVLLVHPSTSGSGQWQRDEQGRDIPDHDAVLRCGEKLHVFEVSDVASPSDNNGKTKKDLGTLEGTLRAVERGLSEGELVGDAVRSYLVVSPERGRRLKESRPPKAVPGDMELVPMDGPDDQTAIFELQYRGERSSE
jgi:hypothetical protein